MEALLTVRFALPTEMTPTNLNPFGKGIERCHGANVLRFPHVDPYVSPSSRTAHAQSSTVSKKNWMLCGTIMLLIGATAGKRHAYNSPDLSDFATLP